MKITILGGPRDGEEYQCSERTPFLEIPVPPKTSFWSGPIGPEAANYTVDHYPICRSWFNGKMYAMYPHYRLPT